MKVFTACILFFLSIAAVHAQRYSISTSGTFRGIIVDSLSKKPLPKATIIITDAVDMSTQQMLTRTDGSFYFEGLNRKYYIINVSYIEYNAKVQLVDIYAQPNIGLITLSPTSKNLKEVVVVARKKLTEYIGDKLIYNVAEDNTVRNASLYEALQKIPTITRDEDDNIQVNGKTGYLVMVNGRKSSLFVRNPDEVYRSFPASNIKSIEVMNNPPVRYESEGFGGAINIILQKQTINGYNAGIGANIGSPESYGSNGYLNGKWGKFNVRVNSSISSLQNPVNTSSYKRESLIDLSKLTQNRTFTSNNKSTFASAEISYELDSATLISIEHDLSMNHGNNISNQQIEILQADKTFQSGNNYNHGDLKGLVRETSMDIQHYIKNNTNKILTLSLKNSDNHNQNYNQFASTPLSNFVAENIFSNNTELFSERTLQLDYAQSSRNIQFDFGGKIINRKNESDYLYRSLDVNGSNVPLVNDPSNNFKYDQNIYAGYASMNLNWARTYLRLGARMEQTYMSANFISENTKATQNYLNLIPNLSFGMPFRKAGNISFSWNQRIERPGIFFLNPFVYVIDSRTIEYGNPDLKPGLSNQFSVQYSIFQKSTSIFFSFYGSAAKNGIQRITTLVDSVTHVSYGNVGAQNTAGIQGTLNTLAYKRLSLGISASLNHTNFSSVAGSNPVGGFYYNYAANAAIRLKHALRINTSAGYTSGKVIAQGKSSGFLTSSLAVNKDFGDNKKFSLNLTCHNPWSSNRKTRTEILNSAFLLYRENIMNVRRLNLTINYRFGQYNGKIARKRKSIQNDDLLNGDKSSD